MLSRTPAGTNGANRALTSREGQVLECFAKGLAREDIAVLLGISRATLRTHVQNILRKLDLHSISQAATLAVAEAWPASSGPVPKELPLDMPLSAGAPT
jgi:DNA-binding NarL/FixJ family response regulator